MVLKRIKILNFTYNKINKIKTMLNIISYLSDVKKKKQKTSEPLKSLWGTLVFYSLLVEFITEHLL